MGALKHSLSLSSFVGAGSKIDISKTSVIAGGEKYTTNSKLLTL